MACLAPARQTMWQRLYATIAALAEAAETDSFTYHDQRLARLERRLEQLERAAAADAGTPAARAPEFAL